MKKPGVRKPQIDGVLVIDKPRGPTSHDVVARLRRALGTKEIGHAGTLDPMATGVLVACVGEGTKLAPYLTAATKGYEATISLGTETDTLDAEGKVVRTADVPVSMLDALEKIKTGRVNAHVAAAIEAERARTSQVPPAYSAIKTDGVPSYERARKGTAKDGDLAPREVHVHSLSVLDGGVDESGPWLAVACEVSKGYYVRALARDLAHALGTVGHLVALRRTSSGPFTLEEALPLDTPGDEMAARVVALDRAATRSLPAAKLTESGARDARFGRAVRAEDIAAAGAGMAAWLAPDGALVAVGEIAGDGTGRVVRGFTNGAAP